MLKSAKYQLSLERLEERVLPSVEPITLIDPTRIGISALGSSQSINMSDDGQVIAFQSDAPDLVPNDTNGLADVFVYFRGTGRVERVSVTSDGTTGGNAQAKNPRVSPDGRYVLFESSASNLLSGISGPQIYARDLQVGNTILVSQSTAGVAGNALSQNARWSGDSTRIVFESDAGNLAPLDGNGLRDVFLRDLTSNTTTLLSINRDGNASGNRPSTSPQISRNGQYVAFISFADDLIVGDQTNIEDVYLRDLNSNQTTLVTIDTAGVNQPTLHPDLTENAISADGRYVLFVTSAGNLASVPVSNGNNLYLRDRQLGTTTLVSINAAGNAGVGGFSGSITLDGRYVTFVSNGTGLDSTVNDTNNTYDVFRRDMITGITRLVSINTAGNNGGNGQSFSPQMFSDGRYIAFTSEAGNLSANADGNQGQATVANRRDVFLRDMQSGVTTNVSAGGNNKSELFGVSSDFKTFAFETLADNLVAGDRNARLDVVIRNLTLGITELASRRDSSFPTEILGGGSLFSATPDGRYVAFTADPSKDYAPGITFGGQNSSAYVMDRQTGKITVVDVAPNPTLAVGGFSPVITPNGRFVAFLSTASSLVNGITYQSGVNVFLRDLEAGVTRIVSVGPTGTQGNNGNTTSDHAVSEDGRYVAFISNGTNLVAGISNPTLFGAVYQRDMWTGQTVLVSRNLANNGVITGTSSDLSMTADGRYITFTSRATDLTANDTNNQSDVFQWDRQTGNITLVSVNAAGTGPGGNNSGGILGFRPVMSSSGRYVAFGSRGGDLVAGDTNGLDDVFVRDMQLGTTILVSVNTGGVNGGNFSSRYPSISPDGRKVLFLSPATNLTTVPVPVISDQVYYRDLDTGTTYLVTRNAAGTAASNNLAVVTASAIDTPTFSPDGRYVAYRSMATNLVSDFVDANGVKPNVYLYDRTDGTTRLVEYNQSGTGPTSGNEAGYRFLFTNNNGTAELVFDTNAPDLFPGDRNGDADVFVFPIAGRGQIQGTLFADTDGDGTLDVGETGLANIGLYLDENRNGRPDSGEVRLISDATGKFAFTNLAAGTHQIGVLLPDGYEGTTAERLLVTLASESEIATNQNFGARPAIADLVATNVFAPAAAAPGTPFTVSWVTANRAGQAVAGDWQEAVYLSTDNVLDGTDQLIGTLAHTGGLPAASSIVRSLSVVAPVSATGRFFVFVEVDRRHQVAADTNRTNNVASAFGAISITIPELTLGTPTSDAFSGPNQDHYYRLTVSPGQSVQLTLDSSATGGGTELYASFARLPTPYSFDHAARVPNQPDQSLTIPLTRPGTYYIVARARIGNATTAPFTLTASNRPFDVAAISPNSGPPTGRVTIEIRGTGFGFNTVPTLVQGGTVIAAVSVDFRDPALLYATFDLTGMPMGAYDVRLADGAVSDTLPAAFSVISPQLHIEVVSAIRLVNPEAVRAGRQGRVIVEYYNPGDTDIVAPLLRLTATNALLRLPGAPSFDGSDLTFYAHAPDGPAGILRPGQRSQVEIEFLSTGPVGDPINFRTFYVDPTEIMDWAALKDDFRPGHIPVDAWNAVFANFLAEAGTTVGDYQAMLSRLANYLSSVGIYTSDTIRLLNLAIDLADGANTAGSLASVLDSSQPASGFGLTFRRTFQQSIHGRYTVGPFGRGWASEWDANATTLPEGDVVVRFGSARRFFFLLPDGSYRSGPGDTGMLTLVGGAYALTELDGSRTRFRADGKLDFVADPNGNRITAGYDGSGRLTSLTHTSGPAIALTYNAQGFIDHLTDSAGRVVTYTYTGDHLTGYTDQYGSHTYTYVTGQGIAREHALASVNFSDDTHVTFAYDARGRLISEERDGGMNRLTYTYLFGGAFTVTNAVGGTQTLFFDDHSQLVRAVDPLGRVVDYTYDAEFNLTQLKQTGGTVSQFSYDAFGNLIAATDPMGRQTEFTYDSRANLTSFTDALGRTTSYRYDAANNLLGIDYPNGTGEQFTYDASGDITSATNRRGKVIGYETNVGGQITKKTYDDGSSVSYTYDSRGRLETATDATGTIHLEYDNRDVLTKVTYPNGRYLRFEYNIVGQRTKSVDQDGFTVKYTYDDPGRLDRLTDGADALIVDYTYDDAGRLIREDKGNGTATTYAYDLAGEVLTITHLAPGEVLNSRYEYTYDALGRRASMTLTDNDPNTPDGTTSYGYDPLGQLISVILPSGRTILYQYDAVGNRMSVNDDGVITAYTTNAANEYTQVGDTTYTYDLDGNLYSRTDASGTTVYSFDDENRLIGVSGPGLSASYTYDALDHRNSATVNELTTSYLIDPLGLWSVTGEYDGSGVVLARYTYGYGLVSQVGASGAAYYDFDATGNTVGLTNAAGQYLNRYSYLPFGETTTHFAGVANPFTFVGRFGVQAEANGWFGMRFRSYDPVVGRFLSDDPLSLAAGDVNFRRYVGNNPINAIDPFGLQQGAWQKYTGIKGNHGSIGDRDGDDNQDGQEGGDQFTPPPPPPPPPPKPKKCPPPEGYYYPPYNGYDPNPGGPYTDTKTRIHYGPSPFGDPGNADTGSGGGDSGGGGGGCGKCDCPPGDPKGPSKPGPGGSTRTPGSFDPNDITGPAGVGVAHFITAEQTLPYVVRFENVKTAGASAQEVFVTHTLDADLDLTTFDLDDFGFGDLIVDVPDGVQTFSTRIAYHNIDGSPLTVEVFASLDLESRTVSWIFRSLDPATGQLPDGVLEGVLPPNDSSHRGEGFVLYSVRPKSGSSNNTVIAAQASIVFDTNPAILTNIYTNTLDLSPPTSSVLPLDASSPVNFTVEWSGSDGAGSGIAGYSVFVSDNGGAYAAWLVDTTLTSATYSGLSGHTYRFFSVAKDHIGNTEQPPTDPQATTQVDGTPPTSSVEALPTATTNPSFLVNWSGSDAHGGSVTYDVYVAVDGSPTYTAWLTATGATSANYPGAPGHSYRFYSVATDAVGNVQTTSTEAQAMTTVLSAAFSLRKAGGNVELVDSVTGQVQLTRSLAATTPLVIVGTDNAADTMTLNYAHAGPFSLIAGLRFDAGVGTGDRLVVIGNNVGTAAIMAGSVQVAKIIGTAMIFTGLDSQAVTNIPRLTVASPAGNDTFVVDRNQISGNGLVPLTIAGVKTLFIDLGTRDTSTAVNKLTVNGAWNASNLTTLIVLGGPGSDTLVNNTASLRLPGNGFYIFNAGAGTDLVYGIGNADWTLTNTLLTSSGGGLVYLAGVEQAGLIGGTGHNTLNASAFSGTTWLTGLDGNDRIFGGRGFDWLVETGNVNFTLTNTRLTGLGIDTLSSINGARLTGGNGNNIINAQAFTGRTHLSGGDGNDTLRGGTAASILLGGTGNDILVGGNRRDLLIGGFGSDTLYGSGEDDILIHGTTSHDASWYALGLILAEWERTDRAYSQRIANLRNGTGRNGDFRLTPTTVPDDVSRDVFSGGVGLDWFWAQVGSGVIDLFRDRLASETIQ